MRSNCADYHVENKQVIAPTRNEKEANEVGKAKQQQRNQSTKNPHVLFCRGRRTRARTAESVRARTAESLENIKVIAPGMGKTNNNNKANEVGKTKQ